MKSLFQISTHERRGLMEDCYLLYIRLGLGLCKEIRVYIVSWEKTEQNWICRLWERSAPNWERPVPTPLRFLTATTLPTTLHSLGSRLSTENGPCSLGNDPSPPGTARPHWQRPLPTIRAPSSAHHWVYWGRPAPDWGRSAPNLIYTHYISIRSSHWFHSITL